MCLCQAGMLVLANKWGPTGAPSNPTRVPYFPSPTVTFSDLIRKIGVRDIQVEELYDLDGSSLLAHE